MSVAVIGVGLACPLGLASLPALAAMRAGLRQFERLDDRERIVCRIDPEFDERPGSTRIDRARFYAEAALSELFGFCTWMEAPLVLLAAPEPGMFAGLDVAQLWSRVAESSARKLPARPQLFASGRVGAFEALAAAHEQLEAGRAQLAIVGGFDSLVDDDLLDSLASDPRIPGEAAAFLLVTRTELLLRGGPLALGQLEAVALGIDPQPYAAAGPARAAGASDVLAQLRRDGVARVDIVHGVNPSDGWWAQELAYAYLRNAALFPEPMAFECVHDVLGELGPAGGFVAMVRAVRGLQPWFPGSHAPVHPRALVLASADFGRVGACSFTGV